MESKYAKFEQQEFELKIDFINSSSSFSNKILNLKDIEKFGVPATCESESITQNEWWHDSPPPTGFESNLGVGQLVSPCASLEKNPFGQTFVIWEQ